MTVVVGKEEVLNPAFLQVHIIFACLLKGLPPLYVWVCVPWQNWISVVLLALLVTTYFPSIHLSVILLCWTLRF